MLKKGICIFLSVILTFYLIIIILTINSYQKRPVGFTYELAHVEEIDINNIYVYYKSSSIPNNIEFNSSVTLNNNDYLMILSVPKSLLEQQESLENHFYIEKAYISHISNENETTVPYIPLYNLLADIDISTELQYDFDTGKQVEYTKYQLHICSYETILNTQTIMGVVGNNIAISSLDFDYGDISNVGDLLGWFNNFIRSIFNFSKNIISDFKGGF